MDVTKQVKFDFVENDTLPALYCEYENHDLTGYSIELHIDYDGSPLVKSAIPLDLSNGKFKFKFDANELKNGYYDGEIQFTTDTGEIFTIQNMIFDIKEEIA